LVLLKKLNKKKMIKSKVNSSDELLLSEPDINKTLCKIIKEKKNILIL